MANTEQSPLNIPATFNLVEHRAVFPPGAIATDAAPRAARAPEIKVMGCEWMTTAPVDPAELEEASYISSLYEGVNYNEGQRREQDYRRQKAAAQQIEKGRGRA